MIHSKDYLKGDTATATASTVETLKHQLEEAVENGKDEFSTTGRIFLPSETQLEIHHADFFTTIEIDRWLREYGWQLARANKSQLRLALLPVE